MCVTAAALTVHVPAQLQDWQCKSMDRHGKHSGEYGVCSSCCISRACACVLGQFQAWQCDSMDRHGKHSGEYDVLQVLH